MSKTLYAHLAFTNMGKHKRLYLPYIVSAIITVGMFYIMSSLTFNKDISSLPGAAVIQEMLPLGCIIIGIFSCIFILYTNSFLMKQRTMEMGLYNILGMEKRHIIKIIFFEAFYSFLFSLAGGLLFGILFDKLSSLLLLKLLQFDVILGFYVSVPGILITATCFFVIFILGFIFNCIKVLKSNPIELLHSRNTGEKEPKTKIISAVVGFLCLASGYTLAIVVDNPMAAVGIYFIAVLLVIIGTYLLFLSGSIAVLKLLKKNKKFYYKKNHFNSVSGMLYRMKQNAVGLANICILSTMVLVTVSATVSLYVGTEYAVEQRNPTDVKLNILFEEKYSEKDAEKIKSELKSMMTKDGIAYENFMAYKQFDFVAYFDGKTLDPDPLMSEKNSNNAHVLVFITAEGYKTLTGKSAVLKNNEVIVCSLANTLGEKFNLFGNEYKIAYYVDEISNMVMDFQYAQSNMDYIVLANDDELFKMYEEFKSARNPECALNFNILFDFAGEEEDTSEKFESVKKYMNVINSDCEEPFWYNSALKQEIRDDYYQMYGTLFFMGIVLGSLFLIVTVMIIYYKQISEGYSDRVRFEIMQKVGMSAEEVKKAIHSQVLTVFFLPLITAFVHLAFSFPITARVLVLLQNTDVKIFAVGLIITAIVFALIYTAVYLVTAKTYYKIVTRK